MVDQIASAGIVADGLMLKEIIAVGALRVVSTRSCLAIAFHKINTLALAPTQLEETNTQ